MPRWRVDFIGKAFSALGSVAAPAIRRPAAAGRPSGGAELAIGLE